ncbi:MAG: KEOPS complex subunit Cgi121 [Nitrososphaeraceae archaeon]
MGVKNSLHTDLILKKINEKYIYCHTSFVKKNSDYLKIIEGLKEECPKSNIQIINTKLIYNFEHISEVLKISLSAKERDILVARKIEMDFLMRIIGTSQISYAIKIGGIKYDQYNTLVALSDDKLEAKKIREKLYLWFGHSFDKLLLDSKEQAIKLNYFKKEFQNHLLNERIIIDVLREKAILVTL